MNEDVLLEIKEKAKFQSVKAMLEGFWSAGERLDLLVMCVVSDPETGGGSTDIELCVPSQYINENGTIILNTSINSVRNFIFDEEKTLIRFSSTFAGKKCDLVIPVRNILYLMSGGSIVYEYTSETWVRAATREQNLQKERVKRETSDDGVVVQVDFGSKKH